MIQSDDIIFAIYKNRTHLGNEKAKNKDEAIQKYLIAASYKDAIKDKEFVSLYTAKTAEEGIHYL